MADEYEQHPRENYIDGEIQLRFKGNVPLTGTPNEVITYFGIVEGKDIDPDILRHAINRQGTWRNF